MPREGFPPQLLTRNGGSDVREWHKQFNKKTKFWVVTVWISGIEETRRYFRREHEADSWIESNCCQP
jgi:hypothetical protein